MRRSYRLRRSRPHRMIEIVAAWQPHDDKAADAAWADRVAADLAAYALPGGYPNMLGPDDYEQIGDAYRSNAARLCAAKRHFDPDGFFPPSPCRVDRSAPRTMSRCSSCGGSFSWRAQVG